MSETFKPEEPSGKFKEITDAILDNIASEVDIVGLNTVAEGLLNEFGEARTIREYGYESSQGAISFRLTKSLASKITESDDQVVAATNPVTEILISSVLYEDGPLSEVCRIVFDDNHDCPDIGNLAELEDGRMFVEVTKGLQNLLDEQHHSLSDEEIAVIFRLTQLELAEYEGSSFWNICLPSGEQLEDTVGVIEECMDEKKVPTRKEVIFEHDFEGGCSNIVVKSTLYGDSDKFYEDDEEDDDEAVPLLAINYTNESTFQLIEYTQYGDGDVVLIHGDIRYIMGAENPINDIPVSSVDIEEVYETVGIALEECGLIAPTKEDTNFLIEHLVDAARASIAS